MSLTLNAPLVPSTEPTLDARDDRAAIDKAISLLSALGHGSAAGLGVSELARRADMSKSTAYRLLGMLERNGVIEKVGTSYRLGQRLHDLGNRVYAPDQDRIRDLLTPFLADLYEITHETVHLAALHGTDVVYLAKLFGHRRVVSPSRVGGRVPAHATAVGKVLLAGSPDDLETVLRTGLPPLTANTVTDPATFRAQVARAARDGLAYDDEESAAGLTCIAVAIHGAAGRPVAALSVSGAKGHFDARRHAAALREVSLAATRALRRAGVGSTVRRTVASAH